MVQRLHVFGQNCLKIKTSQGQLVTQRRELPWKFVGLILSFVNFTRCASLVQNFKADTGYEIRYVLMVVMATYWIRDTSMNGKRIA